MISGARLRLAFGSRSKRQSYIRGYTSPPTKLIPQKANMSDKPPPKFWTVGEDVQPSPLLNVPIWNAALWDTVEEEIDTLDTSLRELSLNIHGRSYHPLDVRLEPRLNYLKHTPSSSSRRSTSVVDELRRFLIVCPLAQGMPTMF